MSLPPSALFAVVLLIGFLSSSTIYFYNKSHQGSSQKLGGASTFQGTVPQLSEAQSSKKVDELTHSADPKGRLTFPTNVYSVAAKETLFGIGSKFGLDWQLIKLANGVTNENLIQADYTLIIPKVDPTSDLYRVNFSLNEDKASQLSRDLRNKSDDPSYNPINVAKSDAVPYFGITPSDEFSLLNQDDSNGTALVQAKSADSTNAIGLFQPKTKGKKGFWAVLYIEHRS